LPGSNSLTSDLPQASMSIKPDEENDAASKGLAKPCVCASNCAIVVSLNKSHGNRLFADTGKTWSKGASKASIDLDTSSNIKVEVKSLTLQKTGMASTFALACDAEAEKESCLPSLATKER
jgi:hypothetical protein